MEKSDITAEERALVEAATSAREHAWAPVSRYKVGAAVRGGDGTIHSGANVEHIVLSLSSCAERVALFAAVSGGHRRFDAVAVVTDSSPPASPCGSCRQVLWDWGVEEVILANLQGEVERMRISDLLPRAFVLEELVE